MKTIDAFNPPAIPQLVFYTKFYETKPFMLLTPCSGALSPAQLHAFMVSILSESDFFQDSRRFGDTIWKDLLLSFILTDENPMTLTLEKTEVTPASPLYQTFLSETVALQRLYRLKSDSLARQTDDAALLIFEKPIYEPPAMLHTLNDLLADGEPAEVLAELNRLFLKSGAGLFFEQASFKINDSAALIPVAEQTYKSLDYLVGYELQKQRLVDNTRAFVEDYAGLNVLLKGDMGTGKSTMIKALIPAFKASRLKVIEIKKHQIALIPEVVNAIAKRPYPFILFLDDLSFEDNDDAYKSFKNVVEGSLEENPINVRLYATSNKQHLVSETHTERDNAIHKKDVMEEKLSLSSRFGLVISFDTPNQNDYLDIVFTLAKANAIELSDDVLRQQAITWELRHLNRSGRTAEQFIEYLKTIQ